MNRFFIIVHRPTGKVLPSSPRKRFPVPATACELTDKEPPRLFRSERGARMALDWWLQGRMMRQHRGFEFDPRADRRRDEMAIEPVILKSGYVDEH